MSLFNFLIIFLSILSVLSTSSLNLLSFNKCLKRSLCNTEFDTHDKKIVRNAVNPHLLFICQGSPNTKSCLLAQEALMGQYHFTCNVLTFILQEYIGILAHFYVEWRCVKRCHSKTLQHFHSAFIMPFSRLSTGCDAFSTDTTHPKAASPEMFTPVIPIWGERGRFENLATETPII